MTSAFERMQRQLERQLNQFRLNSPILRQIREFEESLRLPAAHSAEMTELVNRLVRQNQLFTDLFAPNALSASLQQLTASSYSQFSRVISDFQRSLALDDRSIRAVSELAASLHSHERTLSALSYSAFKNLYDAAAFHHPATLDLAVQGIPFGIELRERIAELDLPDKEEGALSGRLDQIVLLIIAKCSQLLPSSVHFYGMVGFLALLLQVLSLLGINPLDGEPRERLQLQEKIERDKAELKEFLEVKTAQLLEAVARLKPANSDTLRRVVLRQTSLRRSRSGKSAHVRTLYPNEIVEVIDTRGKWVHVRAFDYVEGRAVTGWLLKKYTTRVWPAGN